MKEKEKTFRQEELENLSTHELDQILHAELDSDTPQRETVLFVLSILEARDTAGSANRPEGAEDAWMRLLEKPHTQKCTTKVSKPVRLKRWVGVMGAIAAVLVLVFVLPQAAGAENVFQMIGRWSKEFFGFSDSPLSEQNEYVFKTDNEGLQQLYDAVASQGITDPVVPTWLPEGYELDELRVYSEIKKVYARFSSGDRYIQVSIEIYSDTAANKYPKDDDDGYPLELDNQEYRIMPNDETWKAIWNTEKVVCAITTNDTESNLIAIIKSIHGRADI